MHEAARPLVGEHDFQGFRAADCERQDAVRTIRRLDVVRHGHRIDIEVEASGLLKQMVRIIVGTLVDIGAAFARSTIWPAFSPPAIAGWPVPPRLPRG